MKRIVTTIIICFPLLVYAQQLDVLRFNYENRFLSNPSALLESTSTTISAQHQKTFSGIRNAPSVSMVSFQLPLLNNDMALGIGVTTQSIGIVRDSRVNLAYSYKLRLTRLNSSYVSLGLGAEINQFRIASDRLTAAVDLRDPFLSNTSVAGLKSNLSFGAMYSSSEKFDRGVKNILKVGVGVYKIISGQQPLNCYDYNLENIFAGFMSYQFKIYDGSVITLINDTHMHGITSVTSTFGARGYFSEVLIIGLSFDTNQFAGLEIGMDINQDISSLPGTMRIIASGGIPLGQTGSDLGMGFGLKVLYSY